MCEHQLCAALPFLSSAVLSGEGRWPILHLLHTRALRREEMEMQKLLCAGRWFLFLISVLGRLRAHGFHSLISRFCWQLWSWQSLLRFPAEWALEWLTVKKEHFWGQTCESTVLKVEQSWFERQSGSHHFICPRGGCYKYTPQYTHTQPCWQGK